jgi:hypothetical protein
MILLILPIPMWHGSLTFKIATRRAAAAPAGDRATVPAWREIAIIAPGSI